MKIGLIVAVAASLGSLVTGHFSARVVASTSRPSWRPWRAISRRPPPRTCTCSAVWTKGRQRVVGVSLPGMLSFLVHGDSASR